MTTPSEQRPNPPTAKPADKGPTPTGNKEPQSTPDQKPAAQEALHLTPQKDGPGPSQPAPATDTATAPPATKGNSSIPAQKE